jgi:hypothetical protein
MAYGTVKCDNLIYDDSGDQTLSVVGIATKANPTLTGVVTIPTATAGDNTTKAASTSFVAASFATKASPIFTGSIEFNGDLKEGVKITAGKLSDNLNLDLDDGNVFYFTTAESTTSTPNLRYNSSTTLASKMAVGDCLSVTIITTANASAFSAHITIDGDAVTESWLGGTAPGDGGSSGVDIHSFTIIKKGSSGTTANDFTVIGNHSKTS